MRAVRATRDADLYLPSTAIALASVGIMASLSGDEALRIIVVITSAESDSTISLGLFGFLVAIPMLFAPLVGAVTDRFHARPRLLFTSITALGTLGSAALWAAWGTEAEAIVVYSAGFALEISAMALILAWQTFVPEFARPGSDALKKVISSSSAVLAVGPLLGPLAVSLLVGVIPSKEILLLNTATCLVAMALAQPALRGLQERRQVEMASAVPPTAGFGSIIRRTVGGVRAVFKLDTVRAPLIVLSLSNAATYLIYFALPVYMVLMGYDAGQIAVATAVTLAGALVGSLFGGNFQKSAYFVRLICLEPVFRALGIAIIALSPSFVGILIGAAVFSVPQGLGRVARAWLLAHATQAGERGTVNGGYRFVARALLPLMPFLAVTITTQASGMVFLFICTAALALCGTIPLLDRKFVAAVKTDAVTTSA